MYLASRGLTSPRPPSDQITDGPPGQGVKLTSFYVKLKSTFEKKRTSFRKNQKIESNFTKYENKHQEK